MIETILHISVAFAIGYFSLEEKKNDEMEQHQLHMEKARANARQALAEAIEELQKLEDSKEEDRDTAGRDGKSKEEN